MPFRRLLKDRTPLFWDPAFLAKFWTSKSAGAKGNVGYPVFEQSPKWHIVFYHRVEWQCGKLA